MIAADERAFLWLNSLAGRWPALDRLATLLASDYLLPVLIAAAAWSLWFLGRNAQARTAHQLGFIYAACGAALANLSIRLLNLAFYRPRPFVALDDVTVVFYRPTDSSFPSNAAAFAFAMAAGAWLVHRPLGIGIGAAALLYCAARLFVGMHYPLDMLAGALFGVLAAYAWHRLFPLVQPFFMFLFRVARASHAA